jgi:hypothetical protein
LLLIGYNLCDYKMHVLRKACEFEVNDTVEVYDTLSRQGKSNFINKLNGWGTALGYLSNVVFCKKRWFINYRVGEQYVGTAFSFSAILLTMITDGCKLMYINLPIVNYRSDNDSFVKNPLKRWVFLILEGYFQLAKLIVDKELKDNFLIKVRGLVPAKAIIIVYAATEDRHLQRRDLLALLQKLGYSKIDTLVIKLLTLNFACNVINYLRKLKRGFS